MTTIDDALRTQYYEGGFWRSETLWSTLCAVAQSRGDATAFIEGERQISYRELLSDAGRLAGALRAQGMQAGEPLLIHGRNVIESAVAMLACWRQGYVAIPVPPMFSRAQLASIIGNSGARVMLCAADGEALEQACQAAAQSGLKLMITLAAREAAVAWSDLLAGANPVPEAAPAAPDELAMLIYSSGTTGAPKGVMHSANTIRYTAEQMAALHRIDATDVVMVACQFGFVGSVLFGILVTLVTGARAVLVARWNPEQALQLIRRHRVSYTLLMPTHIVDLLASAQLPLTDCSSLRRGVLAGITPEQRARAAGRLCARPFPMFGMSECAGQTTCSMSDPPDKCASTDGRALPGAQMLIVDDQDQPLPAGTAGHVLVRGPSRCLGYFGAPGLTRDAITPEGFFRTGDLGVLDAEGYFTFRSRARDVIRRGGVTIVPSEIEERLTRNHLVRYAAIVGVPDDRLGERTCACVVPSSAGAPTLEQLNEALKAQGISQYLWPELLLLFDDFPRTPSLKIKKSELLALVMQRLAAAGGPASADPR
jgi:non-ribosomal peptide synthetase component E (peptide arylation enzyme)